MNREKIKNCFDMISPTNEQKEKMLKKILAHKEKTNRPSNIYKYGTAFAALLVFGILLSVYPQLKDFEREKRISEEYAYGIREDLSGEKEERSARTKPSETAEAASREVTTKPRKTEAPSAPPSESIQESRETSEKESAFEGNGEETEDILIVDESNEVSEDSVPVHERAKITPPDEKDDIADNSVAEAEAASGEGGERVSLKAFNTGNEKSLTLEEILSDETFGKLFPRRILEGYSFVSGTVFENSRLTAVFESDGGGMYIEIYKSLDNAADVISPEELLENKGENHLSFSVLCGDYVVYYDIFGENLSKVYDMVVSSEYFGK